MGIALVDIGIGLIGDSRLRTRKTDHAFEIFK